MPFPETLDYATQAMKIVGTGLLATEDTPPTTYFVIIGAGGEEQIRVASDGTVTLADGLSVDDASSLFWSTLQTLNQVS